MAFKSDVDEFKKFIYNKYGKAVHIHEYRSADVDADDPRVDKWANAIAEYFNVSKDILYSNGRKGNSYEKIWFRYMLVSEEGLTMNKIYKMLNLRQHSTLMHSIKVCAGWVDAYPEVYKSIIELAKKHDLIKEGNIKIIYQ